MKIKLYDDIIHFPVAIIANPSLAFAVDLGLDCMFFSGLTISMSEPSCQLRSDHSGLIHFNLEIH